MKNISTEGWLVALFGDRTLVGKLRSDVQDIAGKHLDPVFEVSRNVLTVTAQGIGLVNRQITGLAGFNTWTSMVLPPWVPTRPLVEFAKEEQREIMGMIEAIQDALRAQKSGLIL